MSEPQGLQSDQQNSYISQVDVNTVNEMLEKYKANVTASKGTQETPNASTSDKQDTATEQDSTSSTSNGLSPDCSASQPTPASATVSEQNEEHTATTTTAAADMPYVDLETAREMLNTNPDCEEMPQDGNDYTIVNEARPAREDPVSSSDDVEVTYAVVNKTAASDRCDVTDSARPVAAATNIEELYATVRRPGVPEEDKMVTSETAIAGGTDSTKIQQENRQYDSLCINNDDELEDGIYTRVGPPLPSRQDGTNLPQQQAETNRVIDSSPAKTTTRSPDVTTEGINTPIRFVVRSVGSVRMLDEDLVPTRSAPAIIDYITAVTSRQPGGKQDIVYYWPTDVDIALELKGRNLDLINIKTGSVLRSRPLRSIQFWGKGQGANSRDFAFVSRERPSGQVMCHVFQCCSDLRAEQITRTLREVCWKLTELRRRPKQHQQQQGNQT